METKNYDINLIKTIDILTNQALLGEIDSFQDYSTVFQQIFSLPISNHIYRSSYLWAFIAALNRLDLQSNILDLNLKGLENNLLLHKLYFQKENIDNQDYYDINNNEKQVEIFQEIIYDHEGSKTIITKEKNIITNEIIEINRRTIKNPEKLDLNTIFNGLLIDEINEEQEDKNKE